MKKRFIRVFSVFLCLIMLCTPPLSASAEVHQMTIDETTTYQTMESFGASGCWWSQYMGLWDQPYNDTGRTAREQLATLLYD